MDIIFLVLLLLLFLLPSFLMMRGQRKRQAQVQEMQASIAPGDRIVNVAGFHGTVVENNGETLLVEIAPGTVVTMETAGIMKKVEPMSAPPADYEMPGSAGEAWGGDPGTSGEPGELGGPGEPGQPPRAE